jgi:hypothetical protein
MAILIPSPDTADTGNFRALATQQVVTLVLFGAVLWFLAAMLVRVIAPMGALNGVWRIVTYALVVPGTVPVIIIARRLAWLHIYETALGISIITATALLLDGVAFAWFPTLYGTDPAVNLAEAAVILWGAGVGLVLGLVMNRAA